MEKLQIFTRLMAGWRASHHADRCRYVRNLEKPNGAKHDLIGARKLLEDSNALARPENPCYSIRRNAESEAGEGESGAQFKHREASRLLLFSIATVTSYLIRLDL